MKFGRIIEGVVVSIAIFLFCGFFVGLLGYVFLNYAPCSWFGSQFEGTCGYRAIFFTVVLCIVLTLILTFFGLAKYFGVNKFQVNKGKHHGN